MFDFIRFLTVAFAAFVFLIVSRITLNAQCPCVDFNVQHSVYDSIVQTSDTLMLLKNCDKYMDRLGITLNMCDHPLVRKYRQIGINALTSEQYDILEYLQEKCFDFQETAGYPSDICADPFLRNTSISDSNSRPFKYYELIKEQCDDMVDDLNKDTTAMALRWTDWENDNRHNPAHFDQPMSGKGLIRAGGIALPLSIIAAAVMLSYDIKDIKMNSEGTQWLAVIGCFVGKIISVALVPASLTVLSIGLYKDDQGKHFLEEKRAIENRLGVLQARLQIALAF